MGNIPGRLGVLALVVALAFLALWAGSGRSGRYGLLDLLGRRPTPVFAPEQYTLPQAPALMADDVPLLARLNDDYVRLTAAVVPSVVSIDTSETVAVQSGFPGHYRQYQRPGLGSGVIVTPQGHILTNHHVVANKDAIRVTRTNADGRRESYTADLIGSLPAYDVAVLHIRSGRADFPALKIGDSNKVRVGQLALAVGNPYGLAESVTQGIISAVDRRISDAGPSYFQTDTPINPGNSGGPLVNFQGEVIGINSIVLRGPEADRAAQNIGFAIPSLQAWEAFEMITGKGRRLHGFLGVALGDVTPQIAAALGMPDARGTWIQAVAPGGPAAQAGLRASEMMTGPNGQTAVRPPDVILAIDGEAVTSGQALLGKLRGLPPGTSARLRLWREGAEMELNVTLGDAAAMPQREETHTPPTASALGALAQGRAQLQQVGITTTLHAADGSLRVAAVRAGSLADGRIFPGEELRQVNDRSVSSPAEFHQAVLEALHENAGLRVAVRGQSGVRVVELAR